MDGFHLSFVATTFADDQWRDDENRIFLAEQQRGRLLRDAERIRRMNHADGLDRGRNPRRTFLMNGVMALRARVSALRPTPAKPIDLVPAASETA
jgi:hypothetical protein